MLINQLAKMKTLSINFEYSINSCLLFNLNIQELTNYFAIKFNQNLMQTISYFDIYFLFQFLMFLY